MINFSDNTVLGEEVLSQGINTYFFYFKVQMYTRTHTNIYIIYIFFICFICIVKGHFPKIEANYTPSKKNT